MPRHREPEISTAQFSMMREVLRRKEKGSKPFLVKVEGRDRKTAEALVRRGLIELLNSPWPLVWLEVRLTAEGEAMAKIVD